MRAAVEAVLSGLGGGVPRKARQALLWLPTESWVSAGAPAEEYERFEHFLNSALDKAGAGPAERAAAAALLAGVRVNGRSAAFGRVSALMDSAEAGKRFDSEGAARALYDAMGELAALYGSGEVGRGEYEELVRRAVRLRSGIDSAAVAAEKRRRAADAMAVRRAVSKRGGQYDAGLVGFYGPELPFSQGAMESYVPRIGEYLRS